MTGTSAKPGPALAAAGLRAAGLLLGALATILVARLLQPDRFGDFAFVMSLVTIVSVPPTIGLRQVLAREAAYATAHGDQARLSALWLWALRWSGGITVLLACLLALWALTTQGRSDLRLPLLAGALVLLLLPMPQLFAGVVQGLGRVATSLLPEALVRPGVLLTLIGLIWATSGQVPPAVTTLLLAVALAVALEAVVGAILFRRATGLRPFWARDRATDLPRGALALSALSFGAIASVHLINNNLDVVMLGLLTGERETGLYRAATVLSELVAFGLGVVNFVILPRIAGLHARADREGLQKLVTTSARIIAVMAALGLAVLLLAGGPILSGLFGAEFAQARGALIILAFGQLANALFGPVALVLNMTGHERLTLVGVSIAVVLNAVLNLALIPRYGIEGAAIASASALILWNVVLALLLKRQVGYDSTIFAGRARSPKRP